MLTAAIESNQHKRLFLNICSSPTRVPLVYSGGSSCLIRIPNKCWWMYSECILLRYIQLAIIFIIDNCLDYKIWENSNNAHYNFFIVDIQIAFFIQSTVENQKKFLIIFDIFSNVIKHLKTFILLHIVHSSQRSNKNNHWYFVTHFQMLIAVW